MKYFARAHTRVWRRVSGSGGETREIELWRNLLIDQVQKKKNVFVNCGWKCVFISGVEKVSSV